ncbi:MAG: hypothetical protein AB1641_29590 [Thermodesulfobacteriota bacterium]
MKKLSGLLIAGVCLALVAGCAQYRLDLNKEKSSLTSETVASSIAPAYNKFGRLAGFVLTVENKTDKSIELVWEKTFYQLGGQNKGNFLFADASSADRNQPRPPDSIFASVRIHIDDDSIHYTYYVPPEKIPARSTWKKFVFPLELVRSVPPLGLLNDPLPSGDNGVYLTLKIDDQELNKTMVLKVNRVKRS